MASNVEATRKGYEAFQRGDIPALIRDLIDDDCTWITPGPQDKLPWAGTFRGKDNGSGFSLRTVAKTCDEGFSAHAQRLRPRPG